VARTAFDTGFLVKYLAGHPKAKQLFAKASLGSSILPSPVYFELESLVLRGKISKEKWLKFKEIMEELAEFYPLDKQACIQAAKLRHTFGLSSVDAMIVGIAIVSNCKLLLTTDRASLASRLRYSELRIKIKVVE